MVSEVQRIPLRRVGQHNVLHEFRYAKAGRIEIMVGKVKDAQQHCYVIYLRSPEVENRLLATVYGEDPSRIGPMIDTLWQSVETALFFARDHAGHLLFDDDPKPWGAA